MSRKDDYQRKAQEQSDDADDLEAGRWRWSVNGSDVSASEAKRKRGLAAKLFGLSEAYDD